MGMTKLFKQDSPPSHPQKRGIGLRTDLITAQPTTILVRMKPDWTYHYAATRMDGSPILSTRKGSSLNPLNEQRDFYDASGLPLYTLRNDKSSLFRCVQLELPGRSGHRILRAKAPSFGLGNFKMEYEFRNAAAGGEPVTVYLRSQDSNSLESHVVCDGRTVAVVKRGYDLYKKGKVRWRPEYQVDVAAGMDLGLISIITVTLAGAIDFPDDIGRID